MMKQLQIHFYTKLISISLRRAYFPFLNNHLGSLQSQTKRKAPPPDPSFLSGKCFTITKIKEDRRVSLSSPYNVKMDFVAICCLVKTEFKSDTH